MTIIIKYLIMGLIFGLTNLLTFGQSERYNFGHVDYTKGLSNNRIVCFAEDNSGFIWIGTGSGLNRYDGHHFKVFRHDASDPASIPDNMVQAICKDQLGRFWISTSRGITLFNPNTEKFTNEITFPVDSRIFSQFNFILIRPFGENMLVFYSPEYGILLHNVFTNHNEMLTTEMDSKKSIIESDISDITSSGDFLYLLHRSGDINIIDINNRKLHRKFSPGREIFKETDQDYQFFVDNSQNIWVYSNDEGLGIVCIKPEEGTLHITTESEPSLNSNIVSAIVQDSDGKIWIGTDHGGLNIFDPENNQIIYLQHNKSNKNSISQNVITELYKSNDNIIWIGTFKQGVNYYHKNLFRFHHFTNQSDDKSSLPYNDVNCFVEDRSGNLWIGTNGHGLVYFNRNTNEFTSLTSDPGIRGTLQSDVIVALLIDKQDQLWIGTYHGGLAVYDGERLRNYLNDPTDPESISDNRIWDIFEDSKKNLWIGTLGGGLELFDRDKQKFTHVDGVNSQLIKTGFILDINEDSSGNLWIGTDNGVYILQNQYRDLKHYRNENGINSSLSDNFVSKVFIDSKNNVWLGTHDGLNLFDRESNSFVHFNTSNGLPDNTIKGILESDLGNIWLSTTGGLCKLVVRYDSKGKYLNHYTASYNESDGLQGREFNESSAYKTSHGELIFGGSNGFNLFKPHQDESENRIFRTQITGLDMYGKEVDINSFQGKRRIIGSSVLNGETIDLSHDEMIFSLKFVAIDYLSADKLAYRYKLEGFNDKWIYTTWHERKATYTNLSPGKYTFKVQCSDFISDWNVSEGAVNIVIHPPWYRTLIAYSIYLTILILVIVLSRRIVILSERAKYEQEQTIKESKRQSDLNALKTRFFTNVSHEFRTPLSLILTPLEKLIKTSQKQDDLKHLKTMRQNAKRLLNLVNQILDFRSIEENKLMINYIYGNITGFIGYIIDTFSDLQESRNIDLDYLPDEKELFMQFDKDKLEKIMINLLSNAFKFTPEKGYIRIFTEIAHIGGNEYLSITVKDSGIGIDKDQQEEIFERFHQAELPKNFITRGSGIGLSLTKDFVELMGGTIKVESEPGRGSKFIVSLPVNRNPANETILDMLPNDEVPEYDNVDKDLPALQLANKKTVMLVDDSVDFRYYLKDSLAGRFNIMEAENGREALGLLKNKQPDLIVSDVMMPEIDGLELCNEIKTNPSFSHIPVILLTAKSAQQDKLEGLKLGADEYIAKPFSLDILEARIDYLLSQRARFISDYQKSLQVETNSNSITPLDEKLLKKAFDLINDNISNSEYSVEKLSKELGMSRVYLYKKTCSLTGKTPVELIRLVRLKKAKELLITSHLTISEVAYEVGFSDPRYFSKQFKAEFKVLPSKFREKQGM